MSNTDIDVTKKIVPARKTVPFGPNEQDLLKYTEEIYKNKGLKFATYVKKLIREDMGHQKSLDSRIEQILDDYFKNKNITIEEKEEAISKAKFNKEDKSALLSFLKK